MTQSETSHVKERTNEFIGPIIFWAILEFPKVLFGNKLYRLCEIYFSGQRLGLSRRMICCKHSKTLGKDARVIALELQFPKSLFKYQKLKSLCITIFLLIFTLFSISNMLNLATVFYFKVIQEGNSNIL
jgi:hypothetical protein